MKVFVGFLFITFLLAMRPRSTAVGQRRLLLVLGCAVVAFALTRQRFVVG